MKRKNIFEQLFCEHKWYAHGWLYVKCEKCGKVRENKELNTKLLDEKFNRMYGCSKKEMIQLKGEIGI